MTNKALEQELFQPVLVSWYTPTDHPQEQKVICANEKQLQFFREKLHDIRYWEQRLYSVSEEKTT